MASATTNLTENNQFTVPAKAKRYTMILMVIGAIALIYGIVQAFMGGGHEEAGAHGHHNWQQTRLWAGLLINGFFFFGLGLCATFFLAVQYASHAGWSVVLKRVMEAISSFLPYGAVVLIIVFAVGSVGGHHLYHWMDSEAVAHDPLLLHKKPYLNIPFFWVRTLMYLGVWLLFARLFRKRSLLQDQLQSVSRKFHNKNAALAAGFLVFFGYTSVTASWDWLMSIDAHWFSTIYGWYIFSGFWCAGLVMITMITIYLKKLGYLKAVNENHLHDMGKWIFAVSFLWSYLFFCQFMLIWYSNIPEEVTYYIARIQDYKVLFWGTFIINFVFPMLILMSKDSKRSMSYLVPIGVIVFIGHWLDTFLIVSPGTVKSHWHLGFYEIGLMLGFLGLFLNVVLRTLTKAPLSVKNHPYMEESLHHEIN